ncbi:D-aminoacyl-tRNA deacylase [Vitis vinifera]|uniref:D-aminoacyl-tRNA deacylase n=1 Tax=Vitis vinifera TaxID=29760 RepID=A0A438CBN9_VITVI|nr:D-aminoacyl-tRNA deacylase [Vitis vinifera]
MMVITKVLLGIGGGHYAPRHMDIVRNDGVWVGHLLSGYALPMEDPGKSKAQEMQRMLVELGNMLLKSHMRLLNHLFSGEVLAHLDQKSFKSWQKNAITEFLTEQNIKIGKPGQLTSSSGKLVSSRCTTGKLASVYFFQTGLEKVERSQNSRRDSQGTVFHRLSSRLLDSITMAMTSRLVFLIAFLVASSCTTEAMKKKKVTNIQFYMHDMSVARTRLLSRRPAHSHTPDEFHADGARSRHLRHGITAG